MIGVGWFGGEGDDVFVNVYAFVIVMFLIPTKFWIVESGEI